MEKKVQFLGRNCIHHQSGVCNIWKNEAFSCKEENCPLLLHTDLSNSSEVTTCFGYHENSNWCECFATECICGGKADSPDCYLKKQKNQ